MNEETGCDELLLTKYRDKNGADGVLFIAWHERQDGISLIQSEFIQMPEHQIKDFLRDYSQLSGQNFIDRFVL